MRSRLIGTLVFGIIQTCSFAQNKADLYVVIGGFLEENVEQSSSAVIINTMNQADHLLINLRLTSVNEKVCVENTDSLNGIALLFENAMGSIDSSNCSRTISLDTFLSSELSISKRIEADFIKCNGRFFPLINGISNCEVYYRSQAKDSILSFNDVDIISFQNLIQLVDRPVHTISLSKTGIRDLAGINELNIKHLDLSYNNLKEIIPSLSDCRTLISISFSENELTNLPVSFSYLDNLEDLDLSNNNFIVIPEVLLKLKKLRRIDLSGNKIPEKEIRRFRKRVNSDCEVIY